MSLPLISVVIPAYNAASLITKALDTIYQQTYRPIEVIIVDDGSSDNTSSTIEKYQKKMTVKHLDTHIDIQCYYQKNAGPSTARNTGIKKSTGQFIAFLDVDDLWQENKLEKQFKLFRKDKNIDIIFTNAKIIRDFKDSSDSFDFFVQENIDQDYFGHSFLVNGATLKLLELNFIHTSSVMLKHTCVSTGLLFDENKKYAEDWELWLKLSIHSFNFAYLCDACVIKKEDGDGLTSHKNAMLLAIVDVLDSFWDENDKAIRKLGDSQRISLIISKKYRWIGYYFFNNKDYTVARQIYFKSFSISRNLPALYGLLKSIVLDFFNLNKLLDLCLK